MDKFNWFKWFNWHSIDSSDSIGTYCFLKPRLARWKRMVCSDPAYQCIITRLTRLKTNVQFHSQWSCGGGMDFIVIEAGGSPLNLKQSSISLQCQMSTLNVAVPGTQWSKAHNSYLPIPYLCLDVNLMYWCTTSEFNCVYWTLRSNPNREDVGDAWTLVVLVTHHSSQWFNTDMICPGSSWAPRICTCVLAFV